MPQAPVQFLGQTRELQGTLSVDLPSGWVREAAQQQAGGAGDAVRHQAPPPAWQGYQECGPGAAGGSGSKVAGGRSDEAAGGSCGAAVGAHGSGAVRDGPCMAAGANGCASGPPAGEWSAWRQLWELLPLGLGGGGIGRGSDEDILAEECV